MWVVFLVAVMGIIFVLSAQDGDVSADVSEAIANDMGIVATDIKYTASTQPILAGLSIRKLAHVFLFALLGLAVYGVVMTSSWKYFQQKSYSVKVIWIIVFCSGCACLDEFHQFFVVGRNGRLSDIFLDMLGVGIVLGVLTGIRRMFKR